MPTVKMPDGALVEMPEQISPEQQAQLASLVSQEEPGVMKQTGTSLLAGFGKGAASIPKLLALSPDGPESSPRARFLNKIADTATNFYKKIGMEGIQNPWGRAGVEGLGGGLAFGAVSPVGMVSSVAGGLGGEVGERVSPGNPLAHVLGSVAGGLAGGVAASKIAGVRPQSGAVAKEALEGISEQQLMAAQKYQADLAAKGMQIDLAQALEAQGVPANNLTRIRDILANKPQGTKLQEVLRNQPGQLSMEASQAAGRLPGNVRSQTEVANNLQEAATGAVQQAKDARSAAVRGLYAQAKDLPAEARGNLAGIVKGFLSQPGLSDKAKAEATTFLQRLSGQSDELSEAVTTARTALKEAKTPSARAAAQKALADANGALAAAGKQPLRALDVDTWIGELSGAFKGTPLNPVDPKAAGQVKFLTKKLNERFQALSSEVKAAEAKFAELSESLVNPVKQGPAGMVATPRGYRPDTQAAIEKLESFLERGTDLNSKTSDIRTLGTQLAKSNPEAFADALKTYVSKRMGKSMQAGVGENALQSTTAANNPNMAAKIWDGLGWDDALKAQGLKDAVAVSAKTMGQKPEEVVRGLTNFMQIVKAMKSRPGAVGGMGQADLEQIAGNSQLASGIRMFGMIPFSDTARKVQNSVLNKTLSEFDTILTSPEGAAMLVKLGKVPVMSRAAQTILATYGSTAAEPGQVTPP